MGFQNHNQLTTINTNNDKKKNSLPKRLPQLPQQGEHSN